MPTIKVWTEWTPRWAKPHIKARYEPRTFYMGMPDEQKIECECLHCGTKWKGSCVSGNVRKHIQNFALAHAHNSATTEARYGNPGDSENSKEDQATRERVEGKEK